MELAQPVPGAVPSAATSRGEAARLTEESPNLAELRKRLAARRITQLVQPRALRGRAKGQIRPLALGARMERFALVELEPGQDLDAALERCRADPEVLSAQPNFIYTPDREPNDPEFNQQYAHEIAQAEAGWDIETGDPAVALAIIGSGIDRTHPDLAANMWENDDEIPGNGVDDDGNGFVDDRWGWDFLDGDADPTPEIPHETEVAGVAAAVANNSLGVAGVAWNVRIMTLRVSFTSAAVTQAIVYATDNGARVINMSFGNYDVARYGPDTAVETAVDSALASGIVLVATAGNDAIRTPRYPAALPAVIAVAATDAADQRAGFSNHGSWVSLAAPGAGIRTTGSGDSYATVSGTSFAAPYVAGVAALLFSKEANLGPLQARRRIEYSADPLATDFFVGAGRVNVFRALDLDAEPDLFALIRTPLDGGLTGETVRVAGTALGDAFRLEIRRSGDPAWDLLASGGEVVDGELYQSAEGELEDGLYDLRLTALRGAESAVHEVSFFRFGDILPGWPARAHGSVTSAPTWADIDGDGDIEVVVSSQAGTVHAWHHDGTPVSGWPASGSPFMEGSPSIGDIDGDGDPEIVQSTNTSGVYAWHSDGTVVAGWPRLEGSLVRGAVALADFDGDGVLEAVAAELSGQVHVLRGDGSELPGWPVSTDHNIQTTPAIGDLDGDGALEVVVHQWKKIYAWHADGTPVEGWPVDAPGLHTSPILIDMDGDGGDEVIAAASADLRALDEDGSEIFKTPLQGLSLGILAAGDVDGDGRPEICVSSRGADLIDLDGNLLPGWRVSVGAKVYCAFGDVDGDGLQEAVATSQTGSVYAWEIDGSAAPGPWPLPVGAPIFQSPTLGDLNGDGELDLLVASAAGEVFVFGLGVAHDPSILDWPTFQQSERHEGRAIPVPEPSAALQLVTAILTMVWLRRRRVPGGDGPATGIGE